MIDKSDDQIWPDLPYESWKATCTTLQLWTQVVGKIRLKFTPWLNHSWHVTLYLTARGLTTSPIPFEDRTFEIEFDFNQHVLDITSSDGDRRRIALERRTVAEFYTMVISALRELHIPVKIGELPCEIPDAIPFSRDQTHSAYDPEYASRFWRVLTRVDCVFKQFRTSFIGKSSPVHFFWGSFDLAVTRFSGRRAPPHPGGAPGLADIVMREAYSHEVSSTGFWPGGGGIDYPAFYSYAYPQPEGYRRSPVGPKEAFFDDAIGEFLLPYNAVRKASNPEAVLLNFLQSTYEAAAKCGDWDRPALECAIGRPNVPRPI